MPKQQKDSVLVQHMAKRDKCSAKAVLTSGSGGLLSEAMEEIKEIGCVVKSLQSERRGSTQTINLMAPSSIGVDPGHGAQVL